MMRPRIQGPFSALPKGQQGSVMVLLVITLASILLVGALALDGGHMLVNKTRLQNAVDAAALSGANNSGASSLIGNLSTANLSLIYLDRNGAVVANPNDLTSANGFLAIRYVQLQVANFSFNLLIPGFGGTFILPVFRSTVPRESLGRQPETAVTPEITPC